MRALAYALALLILLAGCADHRRPQLTPGSATSSTDSAPSAGTSSSTAASTAPPTVPPSGVVVFPTPPQPDARTRAAYLADLNLADPDIVHGKPDQAVDRGIAQCATFQQFPDDLDHVIGIARERFTSPNHPLGFPLGDTKYIVQMVHKHLCPSYLYPATPTPGNAVDRPNH